MYTYKTFNATTLPTALPEADVGTGPVRSDAILLPAGTIWDPRDTATTARNKKRIYTIEYRCLIKAASAAAAHTAYQVLRAQVGQYAKLYRELYDASTQWMNCRLLEITSTRTPGMNSYLPISMIFETRQQVWNGASNTDDVTLTNSGATQTSAEINNAGDAVQTAVTVTITPSGSAITECRVRNTETAHLSDFVYGGSIDVATDLVVSNASWRVTNDAVADWDNLTLGTYHYIPDLIRLMPGNNTIYIYRTGGDADSNCEFGFYDAYA